MSFRYAVKPNPTNQSTSLYVTSSCHVYDFDLQIHFIFPTLTEPFYSISKFYKFRFQCILRVDSAAFAYLQCFLGHTKSKTCENTLKIYINVCSLILYRSLFCYFSMTRRWCNHHLLFLCFCLFILSSPAFLQLRRSHLFTYSFNCFDYFH